MPVMRAVFMRFKFSEIRPKSKRRWRVKKGEPGSSPCVTPNVGASSRDRASSARGTFHFARVHATCADLHLLDFSVDDSTHDLKIGLPGTAGLVVRVGNIVSERDALVAGKAAMSRDSHC